MTLYGREKEVYVLNYARCYTVSIRNVCRIFLHIKCYDKHILLYGVSSRRRRRRVIEIVIVLILITESYAQSA